jgi:hypothetical protein
MTHDTLSAEDRALAAAEHAWNAAMLPRDGDEPRECMWAAVFAARDVYAAEVAWYRDWADKLANRLSGVGAGIDDWQADYQMLNQYRDERNAKDFG